MSGSTVVGKILGEEAEVREAAPKAPAKLQKWIDRFVDSGMRDLSADFSEDVTMDAPEFTEYAKEYFGGDEQKAISALMPAVQKSLIAAVKKSFK